MELLFVAVVALVVLARVDAPLWPRPAGNGGGANLRAPGPGAGRTGQGSRAKDQAPQAGGPLAGPKYKMGQRVKHPSFGEGMVVSSRGLGDNEEVTVAFEAQGVKRLLASAANLQLLKG